MTLNFKSVFSLKTRFVPDKWHSALHECLVQMILVKPYHYLFTKSHRIALSKFEFIPVTNYLPLTL